MDSAEDLLRIYDVASCLRDIIFEIERKENYDEPPALDMEYFTDLLNLAPTQWPLTQHFTQQRRVHTSIVDENDEIILCDIVAHDSTEHCKNEFDEINSRDDKIQTENAGGVYNFRSENEFAKVYSQSDRCDEPSTQMSDENQPGSPIIDAGASPKAEKNEFETNFERDDVDSATKQEKDVSDDGVSYVLRSKNESAQADLQYGRYYESQIQTTKDENQSMIEFGSPINDANRYGIFFWINKSMCPEFAMPRLPEKETMNAPMLFAKDKKFRVGLSKRQRLKRLHSFKK